MLARIIPLAFLGLILAGPANSSDLFVYANQGQDAEQQKKDEFECYNWAKNNSGFDPMAAPRASAPAPSSQESSGRAVGGAAIGAIAGGLLGGSNKDALRGGAVGGLLGGISQSSRNSEVREEHAQWERQQAAEYSANRNNYNRAYSACLEGRGYTVK